MVYFTIQVWFLQVVPQPLNLLDQEVDVWPGSRRVGDDHAEEVDLVSLWLVTHHSSARLHHHRLDLWGHLLWWRYTHALPFRHDRFIHGRHMHVVWTQLCSNSLHLSLKPHETIEEGVEMEAEQQNDGNWKLEMKHTQHPGWWVVTLCNLSLLSLPSGRQRMLVGMYQKQTLVCCGW